jgi:hypothetical protein
LGTKIGRKEGGSFQLDKVEDGFWDGSKFEFFFDGLIVGLVKFGKEDRDFDNKVKSAPEQHNNCRQLSQDSSSFGV